MLRARKTNFLTPNSRSSSAWVISFLVLVLGSWFGRPCSAAEVTPATKLVPSRAADVQQVVHKPQILQSLKDLQKRQLQAIENVDQSLRRVLQESQTVSLTQGDLVATNKLLESLPKRLALLQSQREELLLRSEFLDQLIFQVDSKWTAQPLTEFLEQRLLDMAAVELTSGTAEKAQLWRFCVNLSIAVREIPEPRENLIGFLSDYMEFSTVKTPRSPLAFLDSRHYTNGVVSQAARPQRREDAGSALGEDSVISGTTSRKADIQLRFPAPQKTPPATSERSPKAAAKTLDGQKTKN